MNVLHTAIWVSDLDEAQEYFVDLLGLNVHNSFTINGIKNIYIGGESVDIQLRYNPDQPDPKPDRTAMDHIAVSVKDVDNKTEELVTQTEYNVIDKPFYIDVTDARVAFVEGPDEYVIELVEELS